MKIRKCYACNSSVITKDKDKLTKQVDPPKIGLLLYKFNSGMWLMTKKELATLKEYFY